LGFLGRQGGSGKQEDEKQNFFHDKGFWWLR